MNVSSIVDYIVCTINSNIKHQDSELFTGKYIPNINITKFLFLINDFFECSEYIHICAIIYLLKLAENSDINININTIHRLIIISYILSVKNYKDNIYTNKFYSQISGIDLNEINELEIIALEKLNYKKFISVEEFDKYFYSMVFHTNTCQKCYDNNIFFHIGSFNIIPFPEQHKWEKL